MRYHQNKYFKCKDRVAKSKLLLPAIHAEKRVDCEVLAILQGNECTFDEPALLLEWNLSELSNPF